MTVRVGITGMGLVTPLGNDVATTWKALLEGVSGVGPITKFDTSEHAVKFAAEVKNFDPLKFFDKKSVRRAEAFTHYAVAAAEEALAQSGLDVASMPDDVGVIMGSGSGGLQLMQDQFKILLGEYPDRISPFFITMMPTNMASGTISMRTGARGPNFATVSACATGANAIGEAYETIKRGDAVAMIAGGTESSIVSIDVAAFTTMHALSRRNDDPQRASRPFDKNRDGFVIGEGAGVVILEDWEHAKARGATIYGEIVGYASTSDAHHITEPAPGGTGLASAMRKTLKKANLTPDQIGYINAHGTSTYFNDRGETAAVKAVFGEHAYKLAISSTKSMTGHLVGAAGAVEAVFTAMALCEGVLPPTINYETPDPECDLDYVPNSPRKVAVDYALSNSMGFGGHNAVLALKRVE